MKKLILLLSLVAGIAAAMDGSGKEVTVEDLKAIGNQIEKQPDFNFVTGFAISCMAANIAEEEAQKKSAVQSPQARAAFMQHRYDH